MTSAALRNRPTSAFNQAAPRSRERNTPLSYTDKYPLTKNSWVALNGGRMAELTLAPGEKSRKP